jgi:hypothetical protein
MPPTLTSLAFPTRPTASSLTPTST